MSNEARNSALRPNTKWVKARTLINAQSTVGVSSVGAIPLGAPYTVFSVVTYRAATGTAGGSTKPSWKLQGSIDGSAWHTIGAATRTITVRSSAAALSAITSTAPIAYVRGTINLFTTSAGANPDKVATTVNILPVS